MQAEVYIKARKIFVPDKVENTEKCPHCNEQGQTYFLRYFYLSFEEAIFKCGNSKCLYPFHHFVFKNLKDKTVYYYEEIEDGTNDIMLKVSMDGQNKYKSPNPMRTELFSESQHNPDIESYDFDLFDFMDDIAPAPSTSKATTTKPNDDYLDFLDEIPNTNANANESNLDASGVDSFIDNLLNSTASTSTSLWPNQQHSPPRTEEVKLSKAVEHIEKVKGRKKVKEEKPQETFLQKVRKTKAASSTNKGKQTATDKVINLVNSAQNLRPTQFISQLKSLDLKNSNSGFLRTLAKVKEDSKSGAPSSHVKVKDEPINISSIAETTKPAQTEEQRPIKNKKNNLAVKRGQPKPRKKQVKPATVAATATVVIADPDENGLTETSVVPEENESGAWSLSSLPITIDLSRISLTKMDRKQTNTAIEMNETLKKTVKRRRKKNAEVEQSEAKKFKIEQLDEDLTGSSTITNTKNIVPIGKINQINDEPAEATVTVSQFENELPVETELSQTEKSKERIEIELPSSQNNSKSDEEGPLTAFPPVTDSDLSKNQLMDLMTLIPNASKIKKTPAKRTYTRRSTIAPRKLNIKKMNYDSDTQSENASSQVYESNVKQSPKPNGTIQIQNNNNTEIETIKPERVETSPSSGMIELSDYSYESNLSQPMMTIEVEDDTSRNSVETYVSESNASLYDRTESKLNVDNRYHRKKFGKNTEKFVSVNELMNDWNSRSSVESEITIIYPNDPLNESDCASIISIDSKTENTESEE